MSYTNFQDLNPQTNFRKKEQGNLLELIVTLTQNMSKKHLKSLHLNPKTKEELLLANFSELNVMEQVLALLLIQNPLMTLEEANMILKKVK